MCYSLASSSHVIVERMRGTYLLEELIQYFRLSDLEIAGLDGSMVNPQDLVDIFHGLCPDIGKLLDLGSSILDLFIAHLEVQLLDSRLDGIPSS